VDFQHCVNFRKQLQSQKGSVTAEAAIGIVSITTVAVMLVQLLLVGIIYVQLLTVGSEASRIASASGQPQLRIQQALAYAHSVAANTHVSISTQGDEVQVRLESRPKLLALGWSPLIHADFTARLVDSLVGVGTTA